MVTNYKTIHLMAWYIFYGAILIRFIYANTASNLYFSSMTSIDVTDVTEGRNIFTTRSVCSIEECVDRCESITTCVTINYRTRHHVCSLVHYNGVSNITTSVEKVSGFVSWMKSDTVTTCKDCKRAQTCEQSDTSGTCDIFACGEPKMNQSFNGNIYTVGGKLTNTCYDESSGEYTDSTATCSNTGKWEDLQVICGKRVYSLSDGSLFMLEIIDVRVNQTTAFENCKSRGASLTTLFSFEKLAILRTILNSTTENYWIDSMRGADNVWRTSDGREQPMDADIWQEYRLNSNKLDNCTRMQMAFDWKLNDIQCFASYSYTCTINL